MRIIPASILILFLGTSIPAFPQQTSPLQQVQTIRRNVYSRVLNLTDDESAKFWPLFDEMQGKLNAIRKKARAERLTMWQDSNSFTDAQMEHSLDDLFDFQQQALDVQKQYYQKFKKILPIKKVALLPKAQREFKRRLLKILQGYNNAGDDE